MYRGEDWDKWSSVWMKVSLEVKSRSEQQNIMMSPGSFSFPNFE